MPSLDPSQQTIIVTGGNAGIGRAIVLELARQRHRVVLVSRDLDKGQRAQAALIQESQHDGIDVVQGDLSSLAAVHQLASTLIQEYPSMTCLINNAGVWMTTCELCQDGLERTFMVNHMAPFMLNRLLFSTLKRNAPARIVNVNAGLYMKGHFSPKETPFGKDFHAIRTYAHTKLWSVLATVEMARQIEGSGVTINAVHPGVIRTGLGQSSGFLGWLLRGIKLFWGRPEAGADAPVWLATSPEVQISHGLYYNLRTPIPLADNVTVPGRAEECWQRSEGFAPGLPHCQWKER